MPPRSYHSLSEEDGELKPVTKITIQPIDLEYLKERTKQHQARPASSKTPGGQSGYGYRPSAYSHPLASKVKDAAAAGKTSPSNRTRVTKTKYPTYQLYDEVRLPSSSSSSNPRPSASKTSPANRVKSPLSGYIPTPYHSYDPDRSAYPSNRTKGAGVVSTAFLESQAQKFAQLATMNLEKINRNRDPTSYGYDFSGLTDLPIFHPVYDRTHPGGHRAALRPENPQLQDKFVQEKEQLFQKLR